MKGNTQTVLNLRILSQIFTTSNLKRIVKNDFAFTDHRLKKIPVPSANYKGDQIKELYNFLKENYKGEYFYKNALLNKILIGRHSLNTTTALSEFNIGNSKADFVLLNGCATIYEVKSELDNLDKLDKQVMDYSKFADKVFVVSNQKLTDKLWVKFKDSHVGILEYTENDTLRTLKEPLKTQEYFDHDTLFRTLRKGEYLDIVMNYLGEIPPVPNTQIFKVCLEIVKQIPVGDFQKLVIRKLKGRNIKFPELLTSDDTPYEWKHLCYTLDLDLDQYQSFHNYLKKTV